MLNTSFLKRFNKKDIIVIGVILIYTILSLWELLKSGYYGDDSINSQIKAYLAIDQKTLWQFTYSGFSSWIKNEGRFFPFAWYLYSVFALIDSIVLYKITTMFFISINILSFGYLVKLFTKDKYASYLTMILLSVFFQFRIYHDPILSYQFLLQIVFLYVCLSFIFLAKYISNKSLWLYILSIILYLFALLTYEITYTFFIMHFLLSFYFFKKVKSAIKLSIPYACASLTTILISVYFRSKIDIFNEGYTINFNIKLYFTTLAKQIFSSFPLSYYTSDPSKVFFHTASGIFSNIKLIDVLVTCIFIAIMVYILKKIKPDFKQPFKILIVGIFGIALMVLPAVMISLAPKHQNMAVGIGYLPVYIQYFGTCIISIVLIIWLLSMLKSVIIKRFVCTFIILIMTFTTILNLQNNRIVVEQTNTVMHYPRIVLSDALKTGILNDIPENSTILVSGKAQWDNKYFFYLDTKKQYNVVNTVDYLKELTQNDKPINDKYILKDLQKNNVFILKYNTNNVNEGYAIFSKVKDILINLPDYDTPQINVEGIKIFVQSNANSYNSIICKEYNDNMTISDKKYSNLVMPFNKMNIVKSGKDMSLYEYNNENAFEFNSIGLCSIDASKYMNYNIFKLFQDKTPNISTALLKSSKNAVTHLRVNNEWIFDFIKNKNVALNENENTEGINGTAINFNKMSSPVSLDEINVEKSFSIEIILYPHKNDTIYSAIIGNHPGLHQFEGFILQQDGSDNFNNFAFSFGNGKSWTEFSPNTSFKLEPDMWHYVVVNVSSNSISIFDNGTCVKAYNYDSGEIINSEMPLMVGNWINKDRPFTGLIEEVLISNDVKSNADIVETWNYVKAKIK